MMEKRLEKIEKNIEEIKNNHLFHLNLRVAKIEGKLYVLAAIGVATFIAVWLR